MAKRTGKTTTVGKKVTRKPSQVPSTIVTAAQRLAVQSDAQSTRP